MSQLEQFSLVETTDEVQAEKKKEALRKQKDAQNREASLKPLEDVIICSLLQHADKDVRLLVAICVTEIFRVRAPEPPFEDKHLKVHIRHNITENFIISYFLLSPICN